MHSFIDLSNSRCAMTTKNENDNNINVKYEQLECRTLMNGSKARSKIRPKNGFSVMSHS